MRRYRKGQTFRPPTAAESAAHADAAEAHRRAPPQPQDKAPVGQHMVVKTPEAGIDGRDGSTIYWAWCKRCIQKDTADEKELVATDEQIRVFNLQEARFAGDIYAETAVTDCGTRYALPSICIRQGKLDGDLAVGGKQTVSIYKNNATGSYDEDVDTDTGEDWENCLAIYPLTSTAASGSKVAVKSINGVRYITHVACPT